MASDPAPDPVIDAEITGARLVDLKIRDGKIIDGRIVGGRILPRRRAGEKAPRGFHIDIRHHRHSEIVAIVGLGLAFLLIYTL